FVYLRTGTAPVAELVKYDLTTNTETVICNSVNIATPPEWGKSGWITFSTIQKKVWKVYQDGSQLTQLTFGVDDLFPYFSFDGDRIFYDRGISYSSSTLQQNPELYKEHKIIKIDLDGNVLDSVMVERLNSDYNGIFSYQSWWMAAFDLNAVYFADGLVETNTYGIHRLGFQDNTITTLVTMNP